MDGAALRLFAYQPDNRIFQAAAQLIGPRFERGVMDMKATMVRMMGGFQPRLVAKNYRVLRGSR